jgi:hypothetical protein
MPLPARRPLLNSSVTCDRSPSRIPLGIFKENGPVAQPIIWKEITTAFNGRAIGGSWAIEGGIVRVRTKLGEKVATLESQRGLGGVAATARDGG